MVKGPIFIKKESGVSGKNTFRIIVSQKVAKKSTERNLLKRRIKSILIPRLENNNIHLVVVANPGAEKLSYKDLQAVIEKCLRDIRYCKD